MTIIIKFCKLLFKLTNSEVALRSVDSRNMGFVFLASQHTVVLVQASPLEINVYAFKSGTFVLAVLLVWMYIYNSA